LLLLIESSACDFVNCHGLVINQALWWFQGLDAGIDAPPLAKAYEGVFYNYLSIGMDAQVAYGFHHLRNTKPYLAQGPISNKVCLLYLHLNFGLIICLC
jgi:hypothetical protein